MGKKILIYYHNDMDGIASAAIVRKAFPDYEPKYMPCQYGQELELHFPRNYDLLFLVDFSFSEGLMKRLLRLYGYRFCWIDHHITAKESIPHLWDVGAGGIEGKRCLSKSACELTWEFLFPKEEMPEAIKLIGDRDMWEFEYGEKTKIMCEYFFVKIRYPGDEFLASLLSDDCDLTSAYACGEALMLSKTGRVNKAFSLGKDITFNGCKCLAINTPNDVSDVGQKGYKENGYPIVLMWHMRVDEIKVSLRSDTIDVEKIAKKYGGGGHKAAAGFKVSYEKLGRILNNLE